MHNDGVKRMEENLRTQEHSVETIKTADVRSIQF